MLRVADWLAAMWPGDPRIAAPVPAIPAWVANGTDYCAKIPRAMGGVMGPALGSSWSVLQWLIF